MRLKELKKDIDGRYGLRCGRVHESCMDVWIAHDHAKGVVVHKSGKCEPWRIDGGTASIGSAVMLERRNESWPTSIRNCNRTE